MTIMVHPGFLWAANLSLTPNFSWVSARFGGSPTVLTVFPPRAGERACSSSTARLKKTAKAVEEPFSRDNTQLKLGVNQRCPDVPFQRKVEGWLKAGVNCL